MLFICCRLRRSCNSDFTHKGETEHLSKCRGSSSGQCKHRKWNSGRRKFRYCYKKGSKNSVTLLNWTLFMLCQKSKPKDSLLISCFVVQCKPNAVLSVSHLENTVKLRFAGVGDLISAEEKFKKCLSASKYSPSKTQQQEQHTDLSLQ